MLEEHKSKIDDILKQSLTKESMREIEIHLQNMLFLLEKPTDYYIDCMISSIAMLKKKESLASIKPEIVATFKTWWEYIEESERVRAHLLKLKEQWPKIEFSEMQKLKEKYL